MPIAAQLPVPSALPSLLRAGEAARPLPGATLDGRSLGQNQDGQTLVAVGRQVLTLDLSERPPAGATVKLAFDGNGKLVPADTEPGSPVPLPAATKAALQATLLANAGKSLIAQALASNADGTTRVAIANLVVDLELPSQPMPGTVLKFAVDAGGAGLRLLPNSSASQPATLNLPVAVSPQSQAAFKALALQPGQRVQAQVLGNLPSGETEIVIANQKLVVTLPQRVNPGAMLNLEVQAEGATTRLTLTALAPAAANAKPATSTPLQALLAAVSEAALADQDNLAPALATLNRLLPRLNEMTGNVAKAAQALLNAQLTLDGELGGAELREAIARSGVFPGQTGANGPDLKSALLGLRSALLAWLGPEALGPGGARRTMPPARGAIPRAQASPLPADDDAMPLRDLAKALLGEANSALHRLRLFQLAALPETHSANGGEKPAQVMVELPLRLGQELCMAQFQVGRDGHAPEGGDPARRGWQMRFAVNFSVIGEVGAQIGLWGHKVNVLIWAERVATARALEAMLPEVVEALAAKGIEAVSVQCRQGIPKSTRPQPAGLYVDATR